MLEELIFNMINDEETQILNLIIKFIHELKHTCVTFTVTQKKRGQKKRVIMNLATNTETNNVDLTMRFAGTIVLYLLWK